MPNSRYTNLEVTPYTLGQQDFYAGRSRKDCPFTDRNSPVPACEWGEGWDRAQDGDRDARRILGA